MFRREGTSTTTLRSHQKDPIWYANLTPYQRNKFSNYSHCFVQFLEVKVEVPVPKPYTVIKKVPYEVKEYVDKVRLKIKRFYSKN